MNKARYSVVNWFNYNWYQKNTAFFLWFLLPISLVYFIIYKFINFLYKIKILKQYKSKIPVIVVGNITIGGTGKSPVVIYLVKLLLKYGYKPAVISRGYGRIDNNLLVITEENINQLSVNKTGDEPYLIASKTKAPVIVCSSKIKSVQYIIKNHPEINLIISDDGLQHKALIGDIEIAVVDGDRKFGNNNLLPAGPLRELKSRLNTVDHIVINNKMNLDTIYSLLNFNITKSIEYFVKSNSPVHAVAGIGNPERFFRDLENLGIKIIRHVFPDHYQYKKQDLEFGDHLYIIMTEKDAVKCKSFASCQHWVMAVTIDIPDHFTTSLLDDLKEICL